jgi:hypothetical protein
MSINLHFNGQVRAPTTAKNVRSLAPVSRFMQTFVQDERTRAFLNRNGTSRDSKSIFDVLFEFY